MAQLLPQNTLTPWVNQDWRAEEAWGEADGDSFNLASSQESGKDLNQLWVSGDQGNPLILWRKLRARERA